MLSSLSSSSSCDLLDALLMGVKEFDGNPYNTSVLVCAFATILTFVASTLSGNYSQVDKIWSIIPAIYAWIAVCDARTLLMACVTTIWAVRLTWNFNRRGGYKWPPWDGDEDYRWEEIQKGHFITVLKNPIAWHLFNFGFISLYQNLLLLWIACPSLVAYTAASKCDGTTKNLVLLDYIATILCLLFVVMESIADNQQYEFQTEKYRRRRQQKNTNGSQELNGEYLDGFKSTGIFGIVRKPNYAAEQSIWICFYLFSIAATNGKLFNWSSLGFVLLCLLFQGSGAFTENLTQKKYPKYKQYMKQVPLYVPTPTSLFLLVNNKGKTTKKNI